MTENSKLRFFITVLFFFLFPVIYTQSAAMASHTTAKQALLIDMATHTVLLEKNSTEKMHPSSMSKLMTTYVLFSRLKEGRLALTDKFKVSEKAWRTQGSKTFVNVGGEISIEDLIHGIVIQSGNDACVVVAEGISGSEEAFAELLNKTAKDIGLTDSHFVNASGLPDDNHMMTARDLATLAERIIEDFPEYYHYFAMPEYTYNNIRQHNRNRLLGGDLGVDGLKTGHTEAAGYGITLAAKQGDRRLILVLNGLESEQQRAQEGDQLLRWAFREFTNRKVADKGQRIGEAGVWFGVKKSVPLVTADDVVVTLPVNANSTAYVLKYTGPVAAPISEGAHIADLVIKKGDGIAPQTVPLYAAESVDALSGFARVVAKLKYHIIGHP